MKTGFFEAGYSSERAIEDAARDERLQVIARWGELDGADGGTWRNAEDVAQLDLFFTVGEDYGLTFGQTVQSLEIAIRMERELRSIGDIDG